MERKQNHNSTIKHMMTLILIATLTLLNGIFANLYNEISPISTKRIKYILLIPPLSILLWFSMIFVFVFTMIQSSLIKYFKEDDE
jgi:hypothetical protein